MGLGARCSALEGLFGFHNWRRLVAHRKLYGLWMDPYLTK
jgi:hypothetical protein